MPLRRTIGFVDDDYAIVRWEGPTQVAVTEFYPTREAALAAAPKGEPYTLVDFQKVRARRKRNYYELDCRWKP